MIRLFVSFSILVTLLPVLAMAQVAPESGGLDLDLDSLRWKNRILILFSPLASDLAYRSQKQDLASKSREVIERDLMVLEIHEQGDSRAGDRVLLKKAAVDIRKRFDVQSDSFQLILIGKDGAVKLRSDKPVAVKEIFKLIDSMPMRRQEMEGERKPSS